MILRVLAIITLFLGAFAKHKCIYGKVPHPPLFYVPSTDPSLLGNKHERFLQQEYEFIRIYADYSSIAIFNQNVIIF